MNDLDRQVMAVTFCGMLGAMAVLSVVVCLLGYCRQRKQDRVRTKYHRPSLPE